MNKELEFYKNFNPDLSPKQMLQYGVFGGSYLGNTIEEYPKSWFSKAKLSKKFGSHEQRQIHNKLLAISYNCVRFLGRYT